MIPYALDPSLHASPPEPPQLDDGFSPPQDEDTELRAGEEPAVDPALQGKSDF